MEPDEKILALFRKYRDITNDQAAAILTQTQFTKLITIEELLSAETAE